MGDRANLVIAFKSTANAKTLSDALPGSVVLYSHWGGYDLGPLLANALKRAERRWDDESYGARIIVSQMIGGDWDEETGWGLSAGDTLDNERAVLLVDFADKKIRRFGEPDAYLSPGEAPQAVPTAQWDFAEFSAMDDDMARTAHIGPQE